MSPYENTHDFLLAQHETRSLPRQETLLLPHGHQHLTGNGGYINDGLDFLQLYFLPVLVSVLCTLYFRRLAWSRAWIMVLQVDDR